jgi:hypothetical protein
LHEQTVLPSSTNLTVRATITDCLGSIATYSVSGVNITALRGSQLLSELDRVQSLLGAASVNSSTLAYSLVVALEAASISLASPALQSQVLDLLTTAAQSQGVLDESTTTSMLRIMVQLSGNLTASQASAMLLLTQTVVNASASMSQQTGSYTLETLEGEQRYRTH